jgi:hypothetical protein
VRLSYRDEKGETSIEENSAVRPRREVYTQPVGQLLRGRTLEYEQGTLFAMREGVHIKSAGNAEGAVHDMA